MKANGTLLGAQRLAPTQRFALVREAATQIALRIPAARTGRIEIREVALTR